MSAVASMLAPPRVVYRLYWRARSGLHRWRRVPLEASHELCFPRTMPAYALLPAVLSTYLHDNNIHSGEYQLRAVDEKTGALVAVATIGQSI